MDVIFCLTVEANENNLLKSKKNLFALKTFKNVQRSLIEERMLTQDNDKIHNFHYIIHKNQIRNRRDNEENPLFNHRIAESRSRFPNPYHLLYSSSFSSLINKDISTKKIITH